MTLTVVSSSLHALAALRTDQRATHAAFEETIAQLRTVIDDLRSRNAMLASQIETLRGRIALLERTCADNRASSIADKRASDARSEARIADLTRRLAAANAAIARVSTELLRVQEVRDTKVNSVHVLFAWREVWDACPEIHRLCRGGT